MSNVPATDERPPDPSGLPFGDSRPMAVLCVREFEEHVANEYGNVVHRKGPQRQAYPLNDSEELEYGSVPDNANYLKGEQFQLALGPLLGYGTPISEGERWRWDRHITQQSFYPDRIRPPRGNADGAGRDDDRRSDPLWNPRCISSVWGQRS